MAIFGGNGVLPTLLFPTNEQTLLSGSALTVPPGRWLTDVGRVSALQTVDPVSGIWRTVGANGWGQRMVNSSGTNYRIANQTGSPVGATITNHGTAYTSAPTVTTTNGSTWVAIVGGAVGTSVTVVQGGSGYTFPPIVQFSAPGLATTLSNGIATTGGVQAAGTAAISAGVVTGITVTQQGAGYASAPTITLIPDARDPAPQNTSASATCVLTGSGQVTAVLCTNSGTGGLTSVPTLTFGGGGGSAAAATANMCWTVTAYTVGTAGTTYAGDILIQSVGGGGVVGTVWTNSHIEGGLVRLRPARIVGALSAGGITATAQVVEDGGIFASQPGSAINSTSTPLIANAAAITLVMGGVNDTVSIFAC